MRTFFRDMVRGLLLLFAVIPLRLITGRRSPDYARIAALDCGLREPDPVMARPGSGASGLTLGLTTRNEARCREPLVLGSDWSFEPLSYENTEQQLRARRLETWQYAKRICDTALAQNRVLTAGETQSYEDCLSMLDELDRILRDTITRREHPVTCPCPRCDWRHE